MSTLHETLKECGLNESDIEIYLLLAQEGEMDITTTIQHASVSRATVYDSLQELEKLQLIERRKEGRNVYYQLTHPTHLHALANEKQREAEMIAYDMEKHVEQLTNMFNVAVGKPGVRVLEGVEGMKEALYNTLNSGTEILAFVNSDVVNMRSAEMKKVNAAYVAERLRRKIHKQIIWVDTAFARTRAAQLKNPYTQAKFISQYKYPFDVSVELHDNTVTYISQHKKQYLSIIIDHPQIAQFHTMLFRFLWDTLK